MIFFFSFSFPAMGAQRLAASEVMALILPACTGIACLLCSTPCGIRGYGIVLPDHICHNCYVLNALRHQRLWHSVPIRPAKIFLYVLNALRHQRLWHYKSVKACLEVRHVLNALRHQRLWHSQNRQPSASHSGAQRLAASEVMALLESNRLPCPPYVLNALRHQRLWHQISRADADILPQCSTPCGIRGYGMLPAEGMEVERSCAQRLAASEVMAWRRGRHLYGRRRLVLNALRHQRLWHI